MTGLVALSIREREAFTQAIGHISDGNLALIVAAMGFVLLGYGVIPLVAWTSASQRIAGVQGSSAAGAWLGASVTKYVPGLIWHPISAIERLRRRGANPSSATLVLLVDAGAWIASALLVGVWAAPILLARELGGAPWVLLGLPAIALLHPRVFAFSLRLAARLTGKPLAHFELDWPLVGRLIGLHTLSWLIMGTGLWVLLIGLGSAASVSTTISACALSWVVGYLFIPAPAGLGIREAALIALIGDAVPLSVAAGAALVWRILFVSADVLSLAAFVLIDRTNLRPAHASTDSH